MGNQNESPEKMCERFLTLSYYQKRRAEGQPFKKAIMATAHKLIRVLFTMLSKRTSYQLKEVNAI
jgi:hypothetical protein